ncbi:MAG: SLBB domain-containing protein [Alphaproteobacteria bacterium]|nr:SLBB domain-containing protein [Alphaproteobacteria bacterium]
MRFKILSRAVLLFGMMALPVVDNVSAQTLGASDIQQILQGVAQQPSGTTPTQQSSTQALSPQTQTMQPATTIAVSQTVSTLEQHFSDRAGVQLRQFGYDVFGNAGSVTASQVGGTQDSYILGVGDQIQVVMVGHENATYVLTVDRDGRIVLLNLPPVTAAGRTLGEVRAELAQRISQQFLGTKSYISVAGVRQIQVLVTGEVNTPGVRTLTALNTALDALLLSGGVKKTGSLRNVYVLRGSRRIPLDLYGIITRGVSNSVGALTEGDRIVVPPIGPTVAVTGMVSHPGIYELPAGATRVNATGLIALAGGQDIAGLKRLSKIELLPDGRTRMVSLPREGTVANGEVLFVDANRASTSARVTLNGEVAVPGVHALGGASTLSGLLRDPDDLGPDAYTLFAVIVRREPGTNFQKLIPFSIQGVFDKSQNIKLVDNDSIYVFTTGEIANLAQVAASQLYNAAQSPSVVAQQQLLQQQQQQLGAQPGSAPSSVNPTATGPGTATAPSSQTLAQMAQAAQANGPAGSAATAAPGSSAAPSATASPSATPPAQNSTGATTVAAPPPGPNAVNNLAGRLGVTPTALTNLASDYLVWVNGEVLNPGPLLAANGASLASVIAAAGGMQRQADLSGVTVTSTDIDPERGLSRTLRNTYSRKDTDFASIEIRPFDAVSVRAVFSDRVGESITINGQVRYPGTYEVTRDEKLSSVIARAGGLTDEAYAYGAVFTRLSAAAAEADANQREARMLNDEIATLATQPTTTGSPPPNLSYLQTMAATLAHQPTLGRISISIDPAILLAHPERDPLLETGDAIYIPKRPSTVAVTGEVLNQGAFAWKPGLTLDDYIDLAGGETDAAEDSMVFIIMPDGTAVPSHNSWWSFGGGTRIPPGATVVVPRDPQPFNLTTFLSTYTDILSKVALTAASLAVINRSN